ncbi:hypothetical protein [Spirosoma sp.]|uniref:hypothetical protein n=1 Tax=Spirosoma sp. TaxID=1899569 RepID=UPI00261BA789|nr:hypothetical protein [Spirosoma sp.]MCX6217581.1 hypothetical protein [Spirosoma sp.]
MSKHTEGPWRAEGWEDLVVNSKDGTTLCLAAGPKNATIAEMKANAKLIAAAPEMFEALTGLADYAHEQIQDYCADIQEGGHPDPDALMKWNRVIYAIQSACPDYFRHPKDPTPALITTEQYDKELRAEDGTVFTKSGETFCIACNHSGPPNDDGINWPTCSNCGAV